MKDPSLYFDDVNERQTLFNRRVFVLGGVAGLGLLALGGRMAQLQVLESKRYKMQSEDNEFKLLPAPPPRGLILDRAGVVLASNRPNFRVLLAKNEQIDVDAVLDDLAKLIPMNQALRDRLSDDINDAPRNAPVTVLEDISWDEFSRINVRAPELPGITADMGEVRVYPFPGAFAHVIGYVAKVTAKDITKTGPNADPILLNPGFRVGKSGLEKGYDLNLRGKPGGRRVEVDVKGRVVREDPDGDVAPTPGDTLHLTLDADIQNRALELFSEKEDSGAAVMLDCRTGDVLCMASAPSFDANAFVKGMPAPEYKALMQYDRKPLFNKALTANYPPGSTYKTMVSLAALENGIGPETVRVCGGGWNYGGHVFHCDKAHGALDMHRAIVTSCDVYFFQTAVALGPDKIAAVARKFGLGQTFDIGLPGQKPGIVPDVAYKRRAFPKDPIWHPGDTPSIGIGQGFVLVNALQLAVMASRIANGSKALEPRLVHAVGHQVQPSGAAVDALPYPPERLAFIRAAMTGVINEPGGTAAGVPKLGLGPILLAGKTGTAQSHSYGSGSRKNTNAAWDQRDHAWFICFAPHDEPRYAMSVLVEHGGFGAKASGPKAVELMRLALLKDPEIRARYNLQPPPPPGAPDMGAAPPAAAGKAVST